MNKKYSVSSMKKLASNRNLIFLSRVYTSCSSNHIWQCRTCNHIWNALPSNIIHKNSGCPKCAGQCQTVETMHILAKGAGIEFLSKTYKGMKRRHEWRCLDGHCWITTPSHIKDGTRCPKCSTNINEERCRFIFESLTGYKFPSAWNELSVKMQLDGYCKELQLAFEYNGKQHYQKISHFHRKNGDFEQQQIRDNLKSKLCRKKNIKKIDIPYTEVTSNNHLENFISEHLHKFDIPCDLSLIDWSKFIGKPSRLDRVKQIANNMKLQCMSSIYIDAKTKLIFKCLECNNTWKSTPSNIKTGYGCPVCGYVKRVKSRKETMKHKLL